MSRKAKMFRSWEHNYPGKDSKSAFSFAWNYRKNEVAYLMAEVERLKADNTLRVAAERLLAYSKDMPPNLGIKDSKMVAAYLLDEISAALQDTKAWPISNQGKKQ